MLRGRDEHHHAQALKRLARTVLVAAVVAAAIVGVGAGHDEKITPDGVVHSVDDDTSAPTLPA